MIKFIKDIGFFVLVLVLSAGIYWIIYVDKESKQSTLDYTLKLLGEDLLAKVSNSENKEPVKKVYDSFLEQAKQNEVSTEQIEQVAANIMNLSNVDSAISTEQAEAILEISFSAPPAIPILREDSLDSITQTDEMPLHPPVPGPMLSAQEAEELGQRIKNMHQLNKNMHKSLSEANQSEAEKQKDLQVKIQIFDGLKMRVTPDIRKYVTEGELNLAMKELENSNFLEWRESIEDEMPRGIELLELELDSLQEIQELKHLEFVRALEKLEYQKLLENYGYIPVFDVDSLRSTIKQLKKQALSEKLTEQQ